LCGVNRREKLISREEKKREKAGFDDRDLCRRILNRRNLNPKSCAIRGPRRTALASWLHAASLRGRKKLEDAFQAIPSPEKAREWHRIFTLEPRPAASGRNNELADYIAGEWRKQGWEDVVLRRYDVLHSKPRSVSLEIVAPIHYTASLREGPIDVDPSTKNPHIDGAYFGYSASGDVTADVVYAHSGNPEDYDLLRKNGISVKGKIVLVRYSNLIATAASKRSPPNAKAPQRSSSIPIPPKMVLRRERSFPTVPGDRRATSSAVPSPMTILSPATH